MSATLISPVCTPGADAVTPSAVLVAQSSSVQECPRLSTSFIVTVTHRCGLVDQFRYLTRRKANVCARDFWLAETSVIEVQGYMSFDRWVTVSGGV